MNFFTTDPARHIGTVVSRPDICCSVQDGEILVSNSRVHVDSLAGVVYFTPLHKGDEGNYNCTAFNDVGAVSSSNPLRVYGLSCHYRIDTIVMLYCEHYYGLLVVWK